MRDADYVAVYADPDSAPTESGDLLELSLEMVAAFQPLLTAVRDGHLLSFMHVQRAAHAIEAFKLRHPGWG